MFPNGQKGRIIERSKMYFDLHPLEGRKARKERLVQAFKPNPKGLNNF